MTSIVGRVGERKRSRPVSANGTAGKKIGKMEKEGSVKIRGNSRRRTARPRKKIFTKLA